MPRLTALDLPGGTTFVEALEGCWERGDAVFPIDQRLPHPARRSLLDAIRPAAVIDSGGQISALPDGMPVDEGDAVVVATSGSSGSPKGVVLTHAAIAASAVATSQRLQVTESDHWLACLPLSHVGGLSVVTRALLTGTRLTVLPGFDPSAVTAAAKAGATLVSLVATALARIDAGLFRTIVLGGARPPNELPGNAVTTYGMTETGSGVVYDGVALDGVELRIGDDGEVLVRGAMLLRCYRDGSDPKTSDGWLPTGDLGRFDAAGRLQIEGRRGDLIITGGENVWPEQVETALRTHPDVFDVGVAGAPDPEWGQRVVGFVVPRGAPPRLESLRDHVKQTLPAFCAPRQLVLVESIPRTALGKVRRGELVAQPPMRTPAPPSIT